MREPGNAAGSPATNSRTAGFRPQVQQPFLGLSMPRSADFGQPEYRPAHVCCAPVTCPASFEVSQNNADLLDSLVASCVLYLPFHRLSV